MSFVLDVRRCWGVLQMLIGLCGAELVGPESVGASEGAPMRSIHCDVLSDVILMSF